MLLYDPPRKTSLEAADRAIEIVAEAGAVARHETAVAVATRVEVPIQRWIEQTKYEAKDQKIKGLTQLYC